MDSSCFQGLTRPCKVEWQVFQPFSSGELSDPKRSILLVRKLLTFDCCCGKDVKNNLIFIYHCSFTLGGPEAGDSGEIPRGAVPGPSMPGVQLASFHACPPPIHWGDLSLSSSFYFYALYSSMCEIANVIIIWKHFHLKTILYKYMWDMCQLSLIILVLLMIRCTAELMISFLGEEKEIKPPFYTLIIHKISSNVWNMKMNKITWVWHMRISLKVHRKYVLWRTCMDFNFTQKS